ncbi:hypothetical protein [Hyphomicrobium sp.]|uniref:hypothetical protein n=1 Tax=Hyphomicrobium sp. TaxID=82 RepID=UPI002E3391B0|nr:hypothetical protein [Hyphomicrobium sp.]HEX2842062.1 hypothetical protein [Hyphomicrobium sp.]
MLSAEFLLLVICAACGFGAVSPIVVVCLGTAGLLMSSLPKYVAVWGRAKEVDRLAVVKGSMAVSVVNALVAVSASYGVGLVARWSIVSP